MKDTITTMATGATDDVLQRAHTLLADKFKEYVTHYGPDKPHAQIMFEQGVLQGRKEALYALEQLIVRGDV